MMQNGTPRRAAWLLLCASLCCACRVYDASLAPPLTLSDASMSLDATASPDAAAMKDAEICITPALEICNNLDDDCDGEIDEAAATQRDCESRIAHATTACHSGFCVRLECLTGYFNCDGHPENGCESICPCGTNCADAGGNDAGSDDAGPTSR
jgi:hypothetical protein